MRSWQCSLFGSFLELRGSSVPFGKTGHVAAIRAVYLSHIVATGRCSLYARPHGAIQRFVLHACIGVAGLVIDSDTHLKRFAFSAHCLLSSAIAMLRISTGTSVAALGMRRG